MRNLRRQIMEDKPAIDAGNGSGSNAQPPDATGALSAATTAALAFNNFTETINAIVANLGQGTGAEGQNGQQSNPENAEGDPNLGDRLTTAEGEVNKHEGQIIGLQRRVRDIDKKVNRMKTEDILHRDLSSGNPPNITPNQPS
jgi:hypothetical protein